VSVAGELIEQFCKVIWVVEVKNGNELTYRSFFVKHTSFDSLEIIDVSGVNHQTQGEELNYQGACPPAIEQRNYRVYFAFQIRDVRVRSEDIVEPANYQ